MPRAVGRPRRPAAAFRFAHDRERAARRRRPAGAWSGPAFARSGSTSLTVQELDSAVGQSPACGRPRGGAASRASSPPGPLSAGGGVVLPPRRRPGADPGAGLAWPAPQPAVAVRPAGRRARCAVYVLPLRRRPPALRPRRRAGAPTSRPVEPDPQAGRPPVVVAGDFNATLDHVRASRRRIAMRLRGCGRARRESRLVPTWPNGRLFPPQVTIDHVLADERLSVADADVARAAGQRPPGSVRRAAGAKRAPSACPRMRPCGQPAHLGALAPRLREGRVEGLERECIFCAKPAEDDDEANLIVHRGERCFVILNLFPYTNGHLMVAPYEHVATLPEVDAETIAEMMALAQRAMRSARGRLLPARLQRRLQPGAGGGRRRRAPHPHARRPALGRRHQLHAGPRRHAGDAADRSSRLTRRCGGFE